MDTTRQDASWHTTSLFRGPLAWVMSVVTMLTLVALAAACAVPHKERNPAGSANSTQDNERMAREIATSMQGVAGVRKATVFYNAGDFLNPSALVAEITVSPNANLVKISEEFERLAWTSRITPMSTFKATLTDGQNPLGTTEPSSGRTAEYTAKWGPRPV